MSNRIWVYTCLSELMDYTRDCPPSPLRDQALEACRKALIEHSEERAVIEAAEAMATLIREFGLSVSSREVEIETERVERAFLDALQALQEVRDE